jgi:hypothetical protein
VIERTLVYGGLTVEMQQPPGSLLFSLQHRQGVSDSIKYYQISNCSPNGSYKQVLQSCKYFFRLRLLGVINTNSCSGSGFRLQLLHEHFCGLLDFFFYQIVLLDTLKITGYVL